MLELINEEYTSYPLLGSRNLPAQIETFWLFEENSQEREFCSPASGERAGCTGFTAHVPMRMLPK